MTKKGKKQTFKKGDIVTWFSQAGGFSSRKTGEIVAVVPANTWPAQKFLNTRKLQEAALRREKSYIVAVGTHYYWPIADRLVGATSGERLSMKPPTGPKKTKGKTATGRTSAKVGKSNAPKPAVEPQTPQNDLGFPAAQPEETLEAAPDEEIEKGEEGEEVADDDEPLKDEENAEEDAAVEAERYEDDGANDPDADEDPAHDFAAD